MNDLGLKMKQARVIRDAYEDGKITIQDRDAWYAELSRPRSFWARVAWHLFGI